MSSRLLLLPPLLVQSNFQQFRVPPSPLQGMLLSYNLSNLVRTTLNLHSERGTPMTKSAVLAVCKLIELLMCIQYTFHRQSMTVATYITHIVNHYELNLLLALDASIVRVQYYVHVHTSLCIVIGQCCYFAVFFAVCLQRYIQESQARGYTERALVRLNTLYIQHIYI